MSNKQSTRKSRAVSGRKAAGDQRLPAKLGTARPFGGIESLMLNRIRLATDAIDIGFWEYDIKRDRQRWDDRLLSIYGITRAQFKPHGSFWYSCLHPDDRVVQKERTVKSINEKSTYNQEFRIVRPDGHVRHIRCASIVERDPKGRPVRMIGLNQDVTDRENARRQSEAMRVINEVVHATSDLDELLAVVMTKNREALGCDAVAVYSKARDGGWICNHGIHLPDGICGQPVPSGDEPSAVISKHDGHPFTVERPTARHRRGTGIMAGWKARSVLVIPFMVRDHLEAIVYVIFSRFAHRFDPSHLEFAVQLASSVSLALDNIRLFGNLQCELKDRILYEDSLHLATKRLEMLAEMAEAMLRAKNPSSVISRMCHQALPWLGCDVCYHHQLDSERRRLHLVSSVGLNGRERGRFEYVPVGQLGCGHVALEGVPLIASQLPVREDSRTKHLLALGLHSFACFPLLDGDDQVLGTLAFGSRTLENLSSESIEFMRALASQIAAAMVRSRMESSLRESESRYRDLFRNMSEGFALLGVRVDQTGQPVDLVLKDMNHVFENIMDAPRTRLIGRSLVEVWQGAEGMLAEQLLQLARNNEALHLEFNQEAAKSIYDVYAYRPADGHVALILRDVTGLRQALLREQSALAVAAAARTAQETIDSIGEAVMLLDMQGCISSVNRTFERMTLRKGSEIAGRSVDDVLQGIMNPLELKHMLAALQKAMQGHDTVLTPFTLSVPDGRVLHIVPAISFIRDINSEPTAIILSLRDFTDIWLAEQELHSVSAYNRRLIESSLDPLFMINVDGYIEDVNAAAEKITGVARSKLTGTSLSRYFTDQKKADAGWRKVFKESEIRNHHLDLRHRSGEVSAMLYNGSVYYDGDGKVAGAIIAARDITERRRLEAEREEYQQRLKQLAAQVSSTEERARHRIASQMHDTVIQTLSLSNIKLGSIKAQLAESNLPAAVQDVGHVRTLISEAINESRALMAELTPPLLHELGLVPALRDLAERLEKLHGRAIVVKDDEQPKELDKGVERTLFRATRELIMNALKHAGPCSISVDVWRSNHHVEIRVQDDGRGFEQPADQRFVHGAQGGFGLFTISERIGELGGELRLHAAPERGTRAELAVPVDARTG